MTSWLSKNVVGLRKDSLNRRQLRSATVICAVNGGSEQDGAQVCVCFGGGLNDAIVRRVGVCE